MKKILMIILILSFSLIKVDAQDRWEKLNGPEGGSITGLTAKRRYTNCKYRIIAALSFIQ